MMVKPNFVVSMARELWVSSAKEIFAIDGVIEHKLLLSESEGVEKIIRVAPHIRSSAADVRRDREYIELIHGIFVEVVITRLMEIHGNILPAFFWKKSLAKSLLRHLSLCFDLYQACEKSYRPDEFTTNTLHFSNFKIPKDFTEHRSYFQDSELGREQLFSVYCRFRYPSKSDIKKVNLKLIDPTSNLTYLLKISKLIKSVKSYVKKSILKRNRDLKAEMLIIDTSIGEDDLQDLMEKSGGRIIKVDLPELGGGPKKIQMKIRSTFSRPSDRLDDFGNYCLKVLEHGMPTIYIESFTKAFKTYDKFFDINFPNAKFVVCEWWVGYSKSSFAMAVLNQRRVRHLSVEHNFISHIFEGTPTKFFYPLVDEYLTLGWAENNDSKIIPGGSMYPWVDSQIQIDKDIDCLVILAAVIAYIPEISPSYGFNGELGVRLYINMINSLFGFLRDDVISRIFLRGYPLRDGEKWMVWDQRQIFRQHIEAAGDYDDSPLISSKLLIQRSRMVVVTYLSTAHLEAFIANVPTIVLWNQEAYPLDSSNMQIFNDLICTGVVHTEWSAAAEFIGNIIDDPDDWWTSRDVQAAIQSFLASNIKGSKELKSYLLQKIN